MVFLEGRFELYKNGLLLAADASDARAASYHGFLEGGGRRWRINHFRDNGDKAYLASKIDDLRIYEFTMTVEQVGVVAH